MGFLDKWKKKQEAEKGTDAGTTDLEKMTPDVTKGPRSGSPQMNPNALLAFPTNLPPHTVELTPEDHEFLKGQFKPLNGMKLGLAGRLLEFVRSGKDPEILRVVAELNGTGIAMWLNRCGDDYWRRSDLVGTRHKYFNIDRDWDPVFIYRIARVYEAAAHGDSPDRFSWLARFLVEIGAAPSFHYVERWASHPLDVDTILSALTYGGEDSDLLAGISLPGVGTALDLPYPTIGSTLTGFSDFAHGYRDQIHDVFLDGRYRDRYHLTLMVQNRLIPFGDHSWDLSELLIEILPMSDHYHEETFTDHRFHDAHPPTRPLRTFDSLRQEEGYYRFHFIKIILPLLLKWLCDMVLYGSDHDRIHSLSIIRQFQAIDCRFLREFRKNTDDRFPFNGLILQAYLAQDPSHSIPIDLIPEPEDPVAFRESLEEMGLQPSLIPPPRKSALEITPVPEEVLLHVGKLIDLYYRSINDNRHSLPVPPPRLREITDYLLCRSTTPTDTFVFNHHEINWMKGPLSVSRSTHLKNILTNPDLTLVHLWKLDSIFGFSSTGKLSFWNLLTMFRDSHGGHLDLREFAACSAAFGMNDQLLAHIIISGDEYQGMDWYEQHLHHFQPDEIWPLLAENFFKLKWVFYKDGDPMRKQPTGWRGRQAWQKENALIAMGFFPEPPTFFLPLLWEYALGTTERFSSPSRTLLNKLPDIEDQVLKKLTSKSAQDRAGAALWLAEMNSDRAVAPLLKALKKEKTEAVKIAIIDALEVLGVPEEQYFDMEGLEAEATKMHAKGFPQKMEWFPFHELPEVHWAGSGKPIGVKVLAHFVLQAYRQKKIAPSALLRRYAEHMVPHERERFGHFVLDRWIAHDTSVSPEAMAEIRKKLPEEMKRRNPEWFERATSPQERLRKEKLQKNWLEQRIRSARVYAIEGSAIKGKGVLALASACCGLDAVGIIDTYLETYYGYRVHQCKALLGVLAWIDDPDALDLLLRTSEYFRTTTIRKEAENLIGGRAQRDNWNTSKRSDITIPKGRFDRNHEFILKYPLKSVVAHLEPDLEISILTMEGDKYRGRPGSLGVEYEPDYKEIEKQLSFAKRVVRLIRKQEIPRLEEALWTGRTWRFADWDRYLNRHPIMSYICQTIVWEFCDSPPPAPTTATPSGVVESPTIAFRPAQDGTFLDLKGDLISLSPNPDATIRIATPFTRSPIEIESWRSNIDGADIQPFFQQFPEKVYHLPAELEDEVELKEFSGHVFDGTKLERLAKKIGYLPASVEEGQVDRYVRTVKGAGLTANIAVASNGDPRTDNEVVLDSVFFTRESGEDGGGEERPLRRIRLGDIPPLLLSIVRSHVEGISKKGKGFDPEWATRSMN